jgi:hypothetical protein
MTCRHKSSSKKAKHEERLTEGLRQPLTRAEFKKLPPWQRERSSRLHRQFKRVETARERGNTVNEALRPFYYYWRGESYRSNPAKRVRFSMATLSRLYYRWRNNGRTPTAIALRYNPTTGSPIKPQALRRFICQAAQPSVCTFAAAYARLGHPGFSIHQLWRALPGAVRQTLRKTFLARRRHRGIETRFSRFLKSGGWR